MAAVSHFARAAAIRALAFPSIYSAVPHMAISMRYLSRAATSPKTGSSSARSSGKSSAEVPSSSSSPSPPLVSWQPPATVHSFLKSSTPFTSSSSTTQSSSTSSTSPNVPNVVLNKPSNHDRYWVASGEVPWPGATPVSASMSPTSNIEVRFIQLFADNYCYFLHDRHTRYTTCIDPGSAAPILRALKHWGWYLNTILLTHHHDDHIGGAAEVAAATGAQMIGYDEGLQRLPAGVIGVAGGSTISLGSSLTATVIPTPGHTLDAVSYYVAGARAVFVGDTLFAVGCGRLFEGTPSQMYHSLSHLAALPGHTRVFCGHEYTQSNMRFAMSLPGYGTSEIRNARAQAISDWRRRDLPTIPSTIEMEMATNPFLFPLNARRLTSLKQQLELDASVSAIDTFAEVRRRKDVFQ